MNRLAVLLHKEWRDHRKLLLIGAVLALPASRLAQAACGTTGEVLARRYILPTVVLLWLASLAADLVSRDDDKRVGDTLARLPISTRQILVAKLLFLAVAAVFIST